MYLTECLARQIRVEMGLGEVYREDGMAPTAVVMVMRRRGDPNKHKVKL